MKNKHGKNGCPPDGRTSGERNAKAVGAIASETAYSTSFDPGKRKPEPKGSELCHPNVGARACPIGIGAPAGQAAPPSTRARNRRVNTQDGEGAAPLGRIAFSTPEGRVWAYRGKRGRVLAMLATFGNGVTQWDTLPWHTRLGASVHAMREDGLAIETEREGEYRHARYRLRTAGALLIETGNRDAGHAGSDRL